MTTDGGGLRKRRTERTSVPGAAIRDTQLSFRALGVLLWLLDRPDGWSVRADQMSKEGRRVDGTGPGGMPHNREGREAIRTALHELGQAGYYRLERRRMISGEVRMGTAVSEDPVPQWAEQDRYFAGDAVPVVEQNDGSFLVRYRDGSLLSEDSSPPAGCEEPKFAQSA
jgi:hypothetical protein